MEFNVEQFVTDYLAALNNNNTDELIKLMASLATDGEKDLALAGVVAALEADGDLSESVLAVLDTLKEAQEKNQANVGADLKVEDPSIKMSDPAADVEVAEGEFEEVKYATAEEVEA